MRNSHRTSIVIAAIACVMTAFGTTSAADAAEPADNTTAHSADARSQCAGWKGAVGNVGSAALGILQPPIITGKSLGTPRLDGDVVRVDGSLQFANWGNCSAQVVFQMQTKACGAWGCHWETRNHGKSEFLWQHADTGQVDSQVAMSCRKGENSYRVHMETTGVVSTGGEETGSEAKGKAAGVPVSVELDSDQEDGPVIKIRC